MIVTLIRHATAEDGSLSMPDAERALTDKGEKQVKRLAEFCEANELLPTLLLSSPLRRAEQTARLLQTQLKNCPAPETADWLATDSSSEAIIGKLAELAERGENDVWLVGHEPDLSETIGRLLNTDGNNLSVKKASITRLDADFSISPSAILLWTIPCSLMH